MLIVQCDKRDKGFSKVTEENMRIEMFKIEL